KSPGHPPGCSRHEEARRGAVRQEKRNCHEEDPDALVRVGQRLEQRIGAEGGRIGAREPEDVWRVHARPLALNWLRGKDDACPLLHVSTLTGRASLCLRGWKVDLASRSAAIRRISSEACASSPS